MVHLQGLPQEWSGTGHTENMRSTGSPLVNKGRLRAFLKVPLLKELKNFPVYAKNIGRAADMTRSPISTSIQTALVDNPRYCRWKQANGTTSHVLCDWEPLNTLRFGHLVQHFIKSGTSEDISVRKILYFVQGVGLLHARAKGRHKILITVEVYGSPQCPPFCVLFYFTVISTDR